MPRRARGHLPAGIYHVTTRTAGPISLFVDDNDRTRFLGQLEKALRVRGWICHAFCLMPTHYHLLLAVAENSLQLGMHGLNFAYARRFNAVHGRKGHLFGERYHCAPVRTDRHMLRALRYIARNPVKAGLCERPVDWSWSSYAGCADYDSGFAFVDTSRHRAYFGGDGPRAIELLRAYVEN